MPGYCFYKKTKICKTPLNFIFSSDSLQIFILHLPIYNRDGFETQYPYYSHPEFVCG
jgi:hypothetical protein